MPRTTIPFYVDDVSVLARSLRHQLDSFEKKPSHVEMLNLLVKAGGYRNFQHFKAQQSAREELNSCSEQKTEINFKLVKKAVRLFNKEKDLVRWPKKYSERVICLWVVWSRITPKKIYTEREISELIKQLHLFGDHALLRRQLVDNRLVTRTADGRSYQRIETQPPTEALEVLRVLRRAK